MKSAIFLYLEKKSNIGPIKISLDCFFGKKLIFSIINKKNNEDIKESKILTKFNKKLKK